MVDQFGVEFAPVHFQHHRQASGAVAVPTLFEQVVDGLGQHHNLAYASNFPAFEAARVAAAIHPLVMFEYGCADFRMERGIGLQDEIGRHRMGVDMAHRVRIERMAGSQQDGIDMQFADIVKHARGGDACEVAFGQTAFDGEDERDQRHLLTVLENLQAPLARHREFERERRVERHGIEGVEQTRGSGQAGARKTGNGARYPGSRGRGRAGWRW